MQQFVLGGCIWAHVVALFQDWALVYQDQHCLVREPRQRYFTEPDTWSFYLEMPETEPGTYCMQNRSSMAEPWPSHGEERLVGDRQLFQGNLSTLTRIPYRFLRNTPWKYGKQQENNTLFLQVSPDPISWTFPFVLQRFLFLELTSSLK